MDSRSYADVDASASLPYGYAFLTILQSATLETGPLQARIGALIRPRARRIQVPDDRIRSLTMTILTIYDPDPFICVEQHELITLSHVLV